MQRESDRFKVTFTIGDDKMTLFCFIPSTVYMVYDVERCSIEYPMVYI